MLETIQQLNEARHDLIVQHKKYDEATAAIASVTEQRAQAIADTGACARASWPRPSARRSACATT